MVFGLIFKLGINPEMMSSGTDSINTSITCLVKSYEKSLDEGDNSDTSKPLTVNALYK